MSHRQSTPSASHQAQQPHYEQQHPRRLGSTRGRNLRRGTPIDVFESRAVVLSLRFEHHGPAVRRDELMLRGFLSLRLRRAVATSKRGHHLSENGMAGELLPHLRRIGGRLIRSAVRPRSARRSRHACQQTFFRAIPAAAALDGAAVVEIFEQFVPTRHQSDGVNHRQCDTAGLLQRNAFHIGNNPLVSSERLDVLERLMQQFFGSSAGKSSVSTPSTKRRKRRSQRPSLRP